MKIKHNKKRNSAFLYETLAVELTKAVLSENDQRRNEILEMLATYFGKGTNLSKDLKFYQALSQPAAVDVYTAEKLIFEIKKDRENTIDAKALFKEQTSLIGLINRRLSKNTFSNFVPGYKSLATISQIFNKEVGTKQRVLLEKELIDQLISELTDPAPKEPEMVQIDNLIYKTFADKFNKKYSETLLAEQQTLLNKYIMSFADNKVSLKVFVAEELQRIERALEKAQTTADVVADQKMSAATKQVALIAESLKSQPVDQPMIKKILKMQTLVSELED